MKNSKSKIVPQIRKREEKSTDKAELRIQKIQKKSKSQDQSKSKAKT